MKIKEIKEHLSSGDEKKIQKAIKSVKVDGDSSIVEDLAQLLLDDLETKKFHKEIIEIFSSLKDSSATEKIIDILRNEHFLAIRQLLLSTIWNTSLDYTEYLADFVLIACEGDFLEAIDCLTILENLPGPIEERHILESQWHLKEYLENTEPKDEKKAQIMSEIALFLKDADKKIDA